MLIAHYAPHSGHTALARAAAHDELWDVLDACKPGDLRVLLGDFNASIGSRNTCLLDGVCGPHANPRVSSTGLTLRATIAAADMFSATSYTRNRYMGTWFHPACHSAHLLDHVFMDCDAKNRVRKCCIAPPLVNSDHLSLRLHLKVVPPPPRKRTLRSRRSRLDYSSLFCGKKDVPTSLSTASSILQHFRSHSPVHHVPESLDQRYCRLDNAISSVVQKLPKKDILDPLADIKVHQSALAEIRDCVNRNTA